MSSQSNFGLILSEKKRATKNGNEKLPQEKETINKCSEFNPLVDLKVNGLCSFIHLLC